MFAEVDVRDTMVRLHDDAMSRGDPTTAAVYAWSAIRLGNIMIERNMRLLERRTGKDGRGS